MKGIKRPKTQFGSLPAGATGWVRRDSASGRLASRRTTSGNAFKGAKSARRPKVYAGPSVGGKTIVLVEVISGKVEDRKPSFI